MKFALILAIFAFSFLPAFAQEKPLTQAEYVKMLYALQKAPAGKVDIVDALRKRGIAFVLTDGLRGLTRSKGGNDEELKRALEEAERRRQNPTAAKLPTELESTAILDKVRRKTLAAIEEMPDFVVKQRIARSGSYAGTGNWKPYDNIVVAVSYSSEKGEQYKVLAKNGVQINATTGSDYSGLEGNTTRGEFVEGLETIFKPESETEFNLLTTDVVRGQPCIVYDYEILLKNNKGGGVALKHRSSTSNEMSFTAVPAGQKGKIWVDRDSYRVLRVEYGLTDIPSDFPIKALKAQLDYDWVEIAGEKYLLPILADKQFTSLEVGKLFQDRNLIRFTNYQKYGTEVILGEEDTEPVKEEKP